MIIKTKDKELTNEEFETILNDCCNKVDKLSDDDWQDIIDRYSLTINYDTLRKNCTGIFGSVFVKKYYEDKFFKLKNNDDNEYLEKLEEKKRELARLQIQYRDERNAWSKQNYSAARIDSVLNLLEEKIKDISSINFKIHSTPEKTTMDKCMICMLSDLHIGQTFNSAFGKYNTDIAKKRLNNYLNKVIEISKIHNVSEIYVVGLGDQLSGSIHKTLAISNRENLIEQIKVATEIISSFCYELTKYFNKVNFVNVCGNHTRIAKKEDAVHDERLDDTVAWAVSLSLNHIENFNYLNSVNLDSGIASLDILGKKYIAVHGDFDGHSKQSVSNLSFMTKQFPYCILSGHMHTPAMNEINGVKMIQSGSLPGSGCDYTIEKRLTGSPSQTVLVCNKKGIDCIYNVDLKED